MTSTLRLASLLLAGLMFTACDDDESTSNVPPNLKLEDVVGCWYWGGGGGNCQMICFENEYRQLFVAYDSTDAWQFESYGRFNIAGFYIDATTRVASTTTGIRKDSSSGKTAYQRIEGGLYTLDSRYHLGTRYTSVNLDSTFPCGKPFLLFPKPANWTLF